MTENALDRLNHRPSEIQTPTQNLNFNHVSGGERNIQSLNNTMSAMDNINPNSVQNHGFPDLQLCGFESPANSQACASADSSVANPAGAKPSDASTNNQNQPSDASVANPGVKPIDASTAANPTQPSDASTANPTQPGDASTANPATIKQGDASSNPTAPTDASAGNPKAPNDASGANATAPDQSWKSHLQEPWVQDQLREHPDYHPMEGLHPGEIAVGNWEPTKEEKKVLSNAFDKMEAEHNDGPVTVRLPDGSLCTCEIVRGGQGNGQSFNKGNDHSHDGKHRKAKVGKPGAADDDSCGDDDSADSADSADSDSPNITPAVENNSTRRGDNNTTVASSTASDTSGGGGNLTTSACTA